jgi:hypothetical protein
MWRKARILHQHNRMNWLSFFIFKSIILLTCAVRVCIGYSAGNAVKTSIELKLLYLPSQKYTRSIVRSELDLVGKLFLRIISHLCRPWRWLIKSQMILECQLSSTGSSRHHNYTLLLPRDKQVALKADEYYIRFHPRLLFMFISPSIARWCPGMHLQNHTCSAWMTWLFPPLSTNTFNQSGSINVLFTFFFSQSNSITMFLTDPCSYLHGLQFLSFSLFWERCSER